MKQLYNLKQAAIAVLFVMAGMMTTRESVAQQNPFGAGYFQNQYLLNPAMVGGDNKTKINAGYLRQWSGITNSPYTIYATGEYSSGDKINAGITIVSDKAGMLNTSSAMLTYAYYLPVTATGGKVHLGISAGVTNRQIDTKNFNGDPGDVLLTDGNKMDFDGGIGIAYTDKHITVQGAFPNMVSYFKKDNEDIVDRPTFFAAASYKLSFEDGEYTVEPKVAYRGMKGFDNIIDVGANASYKVLNVYGFYHTSKNVTLGLGVKIIDDLSISGAYTTPGSVIKGNVDGSFEIGMRYAFGGTK
jgi:type IX secretion system PorP/SprF family membrane protein